MSAPGTPLACAALLRARVQTLVSLYQTIATARMEGIPLLNHALRVEAVGFEVQHAGADGQSASTAQAEAPHAAGKEGEAIIAGVGVLITPWFMNLVWLPLERLDQQRRVGSKLRRHVGTECFEFIAAHEDGFGSYEACSLFSPVFEFVDHAAAVATAQAVLGTLRQPVPPVAAAPVVPAPVAPDIPARRAFLFGRSAAGPVADKPSERGVAKAGHA